MLAGCSSTVSMQMPTIPAPRVEKIPVDVAVRIPAEFRNFTHVEDVLGKSKWTIELGDSNARYFTQLFDYMFDSLIILGPDDDPRDYQFDALIEPKIEGFEFSVPTQTQTDAFSVWIRYRLSIFDSIGNRASSWTVNAYGKSQKEGIGGSDSLKRAAILAMRDAAALIMLVVLRGLPAAPAGGSHIKSLEVVASHSAVLIMEDEPTESTILWIVDMSLENGDST